MKQKYYIDSQKLMTGVVVLLLILVYQQLHNTTAWIYLALHGGYGIIWVVKSQVFPDRSWEKECSLAYGLAIWGGLCLYWVTPWIITSQGIEAPGWYIAICIFLYVLGVFIHFSADMQKYTSLKLRPNQLITSGFFRRVRNINYFGELLIYAGFGLLAMHWLPIAILLIWVLVVWLPRMRQKDRSLSRYADFAAYRSRTKLFIPHLY